MVNPVEGYRTGQRVWSKSNGPAAGFVATVYRVVVPTKGKRFLVVMDASGNSYHRWFHEIEALETAQA